MCVCSCVRDVQEICLEIPYWLSGRPGWSSVVCPVHACAKLRQVLQSFHPFASTSPPYSSRSFSLDIPNPPFSPSTLSLSLPSSSPLFAYAVGSSLQSLHRSPLKLQLISLVLGRPFSNFEFVRCTWVPLDRQVERDECRSARGQPTRANAPVFVFSRGRVRVCNTTISSALNAKKEKKEKKEKKGEILIIYASLRAFGML